MNRLFLLALVLFSIHTPVFAQVTPGPLILQDNGTTLGGIKTLNCTPGGACTRSGSVGTIGTSGGAPTTGTYLLQTANGSLPNAQALGALGTGLVLNTTITGIQSIYGGSGTCGANTFFTALDASGNKTCGAPSASVTWDTIGAAAGSATTANSTFNLVYQTAPTADSKIGWRFTESAAATNGTSTSGVPNQVLLKVDTLAASTQSPLSAYSRGSHVFSVSPSAAQVLFTKGALANPSISFAAGTNTGLAFGVLGSGIDVSVGGSIYMDFGDTSNGIIFIASGKQLKADKGSASTPGITDNSVGTGGIFWPAGGGVGTNVSSIENSQWLAGTYQLSKGSADAVAYALNVRKSRGTVAAPTVITTGDALATISGFGYVGGTNTYREAARLEFDSTGTIADATTGVGSVIKFLTKIDGTDATPQTRIQWDKAGRPYYVTNGNSPTFTGGDCGTGPTVVGNDAVFTITVGNPNVNTVCSMTFSGAGWLTNPPNCFAESDTDLLNIKSVETQTTVVITGSIAFTAGSKLDVWCVGRL